MKLTDIDLSSLSEVAASILLLEHVHRELATGGVPLPSLPPGAEFVVNPASAALPQNTPLNFGFPTATLAADAEKLRGLDVDPMSGQPLPGALGYAMPDAASIFGGAPAQSAAPLQLVPSTAGAAPSQTAPAALPASGALPALQALAPQPGVSAAASAAPAAPASPAGGVEIDADGLPWDERIHAGTKRKNGDGRWTSKRGINDPDLVPSVVAQLRAQMAAGGVTTLTTPPAQAQSAAPLPLSTPAQSTAPLAALPATSGLAYLAAPTPPALPGLPPQAAQQQSSEPATFLDFMTAMAVEVQAGRMPATAFVEACNPYGGPAALQKDPSSIPMVLATLRAMYPGML